MTTARVPWNRCDIVGCSCPATSSAHVHCPCQDCNGRAVSRSTEYRHWNDAILLMGQIDKVAQEHHHYEAAESSLDELPTNSAIPMDMVCEEPNPVNTTQELPASTSSSTDDFQDENSFQHTAAADSIECTCDESESADIENDITVAVLRAFQLMEETNGSKKNFMDILNFGRDMYCKGNTGILQKWPKTWSACMTILKEKGYEDPATYYICMSNSHPNQWTISNNPNDVCKHCRQPGSIQYHYIGLAGRVQRWCANKAFCEKITAHWQQKEHWLYRSSSYVQPPYNELWDGQRFHDLQWFWNPQEQWLLPVKCPLCSEVISADSLASIMDSRTDQQSQSTLLNIKCVYCYTRFSHCPRYACGDPRNIAFIGHWDGWQPFSTSAKHSCGSIELQIATMAKTERSKTDEVYVCGFVPNYLLPSKTPCSRDPFLYPLMLDIEDAFINGIEVDYKAKVADIEPGPAVIRCLILCWTGDHPAQCEIGKFLSTGGIHACRRDNIEGVHINNSNQCYYTNYRFHFRHRWHPRQLSESIGEMIRVDDEDRISVRQKLASQTGFTGLSILHRLHRLYKFDVLKDLVFDTMHTLVLRVLHCHLNYYVSKEYLQDPEVEKRLKLIPWTAELKNGRIPEGINRRMGYWKAEEFQKFTFPASEYILGGILPDDEYHVWLLIVRITEMVFGCGRNGLTPSKVELLERFIWRHNILTEEIEGGRSCTISLHNLIHIPDDIKRFSSPDNYWCYTFERAVHNYVEKSSNKKHLELTFAKSECRREVLKFSTLTEVVQTCHRHNTDCFLKPLHASSVAQAQKYFNNQQQEPILVGGKKYITVDAHELCNVNNNFQISDPEIAAISCRSMLCKQHGVNGMLYRVGENLLITVNNNTQQIICATDFFAACVNGEYINFVKGSLFEVTDNVHIYSSSPIIVPTSQNIIAEACKISRKVMLYPELENLTNPTSYIIIDFCRPSIPVEIEDVIIPVFPVAGDMVKVNGDDGDIWIAHVIKVNEDAKTCQVNFYVKDSSTGDVYVRESRGHQGREVVHWSSLLGIASGFWENNCWHYQP